MPQSLAKVYVHITFSTKYRQPLIDNAIKDRLFDYLGGICKGMECFPVEIGGYKDHVHVLCILSRKIALMTFMEELKKNSSKWIKTIGPEYENFYWQNGYGAFSVNPKEVDVVVNYIKGQEKHHTKKTYQEEFIFFLKRYQVDYDEQYLWD